MKFNMAKYDWQIKQATNSTISEVDLQNNGIDFSPAFLRLCATRNINSYQELIEKTDQKPQLYHDPFLLHDMDKAIDRIQQAIESFEGILIYGDYDADGVTSTLILYETLESIGANVHYYLPNRLTDGYGPNKERWEELVKELDIQLIITVDNGVAGFEAIDAMNEIGVDCIVTDHHELQDNLPNALAIIHPKHPQGNYPFKELSGAGVALKVATALIGEIPMEAIELAAIGTVADMVSLTDENRTIVLSGMNLMKETTRTGLELLLESEKVNLEDITTDTIGFIIGPRLNAVGRLGDATPALELLRTMDPNEAIKLLDLINDKNKERQQLTQQIIQDIEERISHYEDIPDVIVEADENWSAGVLGIAASRLVKKYQRPAILFQYLSDNEQYKGSSRSVSKINIFEELMKQRDYLTHFGGHSQAAGLTVASSDWSAFKESIEQEFLQYRELLEQPEPILIDMALDLQDISIKFIEEINLLGPFGTDNPKPNFIVQDATISSIRAIGADKTHLKLALRQEKQNAELQAIGFGKAQQATGLDNGSLVSVVGELSINEWNGNRLPQLMLEDIGIEGTQWLDYRSSTIHNDLYNVSEALYVFTHPKIASHMAEQLNSPHIALYEKLDEIELNQYKKLIIMEPPVHIDKLKDLINNYSWETIYLGSFIHESKYLAGLPTRDEFVNLYKWLYSKESMDYRNAFKELIQALNINPTKLKGMFRMFLEAEFVTIKNGRLEFNKEVQNSKIDIKNLKAFDQYKQEFESEALLNYQSLDTIKDFLKGTEKLNEVE